MLRPDLFHLMRVFRSVVQGGSFSAAAKALGTQPPAVSKAIAKLEEDLDVQLLVRSTRNVSMTDAGETFYQETVRFLDELEETCSAIRARSGEPVGTLSVSATVVFGQCILSPLLPVFMARFPGVTLDLRLTNDVLSLHAEGIDVVLRSTPELDDAALYSRHISTQKRVLVASPDYIRKYGNLSAPEDLTKHRCLVFKASRTFDKWQLSKDGQQWTIPIKPAFISNNYQSIVDVATGGAGVAQLFHYHVADKIKNGQLQPVLREYALPDQNIFAVYKQKRKNSAKVDAFVSFLEEALVGPLARVQ